MRQPIHITTRSRPRNLAQILARQPYPTRRLADQLHVLEHRLVVPVLQSQPQSPPRRVLRDRVFVEVVVDAEQRVWRGAAREGGRRGRRGVCGPGLVCEGLRQLFVFFWRGGDLQGVGLWGGCAAEGYAGEEAFTLEAQHEVDVHFGDGDGG